MNVRKFVVDTAAVLLIVWAFAIGELLRGRTGIAWIFIASFVVAPFVALFTQRLKFSGSAEGGWLIALIAVVELYVFVSDPADLSLKSVLQSLWHHFSISAPQLATDGNEFRDVYVVLGSAGFTLYALFFIAVRRINSLTAARLVAISQGFGISFLLAVSAMMIPSEPWWRFAIMTLLNGTTLFQLVMIPDEYPIDYRGDSAVVVQYWKSLLKLRRGWGIVGFIGLVLMPLWPLFGEVLFALVLLYSIFISAHAATFLFISTEIENTKDGDTLLMALYSIPTSKFSEMD